MSNRVKRLAEVQGDDSDEWVGCEQVGDDVEEGDDCCCWGAGWTESKLISEREGWRGRQEGWVQETPAILSVVMATVRIH